MQIIRVGIFILLFVIAALYGQFLHNPIFFDDMYYYMNNSLGQPVILKYASFSLFDIRALPFATMAWTANILGFNLPPLRIENLLMHWLVAATLLLFTSHLYRAVLPSVQTNENTRMGVAILIAVGLFSLNPIAVYAVGYLVQRSILMATLFSLLSLWSYLLGSAKQNLTLMWTSVALYFLATHSKEHVIMLPFVIVALTVLIHEDWLAHLRRNWTVFAGYIFVALFTVAQVRGYLGNAYENYSGDMLEDIQNKHAFFSSVLTQSWLFFKYGLLWLFPNPNWLSIDMREPFADVYFSVYGIALLAYLVYGVVAMRLLFKRGAAGLAGFALLFPWLMFATELSTVRIQEIFVLYRSYVWALGGVFLLPLVFMQFNARLAVLVSSLIAATFFMVSMERLSSFSHPVLLWGDAEKLVKDKPALPGVWRIYFNLGTSYMNMGRIDKAVPNMEKAAQLNPKLSVIQGRLASNYYKSGQKELAIQAFTRAITLDKEQKLPPDVHYYAGRAKAYETQGELAKAVLDYKVTCQLEKIGCDKLSLH
jgi:hypothetical protein